MKFLKILLNVVIYLLALIGLLVMILLAYVYFKNPLGIVDILFNKETHVLNIENNIENQENTDVLKNNTTNDAHPLLTSDQEKTLKTLGIDPASLPTEIDKETGDCLVGKVGEKRAKEIMEGSAPTTFEIIKASSCL